MSLKIMDKKNDYLKQGVGHRQIFYCRLLLLNLEYLRLNIADLSMPQDTD